MLAHDRIVAAFNGLPSPIAILDPGGMIVHLNAAWRDSALQNNCTDPQAFLGADYLGVCHTAMESGDKRAEAALKGIEKVMSGDIRRFRQLYPCHAAGVERWFLMTVVRASFSTDIVIAHDDVTALVRRPIKTR